MYDTDVELGLGNANYFRYSTAVKAAFLSSALYMLVIHMTYEYYITLNFFALLIRAMQWVRQT